MDFSNWWKADSSESFWLEITDRKDLGTDLNSPQYRDDGKEYYGYSLINKIKDGDKIFHYHKEKQAIIAVSEATGSVWEDEVFWGAHGTTARGEGIQPYVRPGWRLGLINFCYIAPISLTQLRFLEEKIKQIQSDLSSQYKSKLYFPFELSNKRALRPTQAYLTKLPKAIIALISPNYTNEELLHANSKTVYQPASVRENTKLLESNLDYETELGSAYRYADEEVAVSERDPFNIDPALVERANRSHAATQNILATYLFNKGIKPRSPQLGEPNFDIAWTEDHVFVAEVKSLTHSNEEKQLRLGLGQVLRYQHLLMQKYTKVQAVLMIEREPSDYTWISLCESLDILLIWPSIMANRI
jgi:hypothetical protein